MLLHQTNQHTKGARLWKMEMEHIDIRSQFRGNVPNVQALGIEDTGSTLINYASEFLGYSNDILWVYFYNISTLFGSNEWRFV